MGRRAWAGSGWRPLLARRPWPGKRTADDVVPVRLAQQLAAQAMRGYGDAGQG